jgi:DNA-binding transcriptional MocR family regulator
MEMRLYDQLADEIVSGIAGGVYQAGDKLPGIRGFAKTRKVSVSTVISAYYKLEDEGYIESVEKSGFYVKQALHLQIDPPGLSKPASRPNTVSGQEMALQMVKVASRSSLIQLGAAVPDKHYLPVKLVSQTMSDISKKHMAALISYESPQGLAKLRQQIAKRMLESGCQVATDDIIITAGCQEAVQLALRACTEPGDVVAIESPTFYGLLQVIESLGLKALEIPTDAQQGISIGALEMAIEKWPVKACVLVSTFSNPLGACMPDADKKKLTALLAEKDITLIEDDVYGELSHSGQRPPPLKSFDKADNVIYCSSFSKTLSPGLRIGWVASRRYAERLEYLKYVLNFSTSAIGQMAVAQLLENGKFDRYLKKVRREYAQAVTRMVQAIHDLFPAGTKVTQPQGGFVIWVELPKKIDSCKLANDLMEEGISIAPGRLFSTTHKFDHFIRISCACIWQPQIELALLKIVQKISD